MVIASRKIPFAAVATIEKSMYQPISSTGTNENRTMGTNAECFYSFQRQIEFSDHIMFGFFHNPVVRYAGPG